jgi:hypothetical protein
MTKTQKNSAWGYFAILGGLALIAAGGAYFYYRVILGKALTPKDAAKLVPQEALMATYISTDQKTWSKLKEFGTPEAQQIISETIERFAPEIPIESDITYQDDINPWLGNIMFAVLPTNGLGNGENLNNDDNILLVIGIKDKVKAFNFAKKVKQNLEQFEELIYQDIPISQGQTEDNRTLSFAVLDSFLVVSYQQETIKAAIDSFKEKTSLATQMNNQPIFRQNFGLNTPLAQIYLPDYKGIMSEVIAASEQGEVPENLENLPPEIIEQLNQIESAIIGVGLVNEGLHFQTLTQMGSQVNLDHLKVAKGKILEKFPQETILLVTGQGISEGWNYLISQIETIPALKIPLDQGRKEVKQRFNLDLDRDIFGWMDGEFGFGIIASQKGALSMMGIGGAVVLESSDRPTGENAVNQIISLLEPGMKPGIISDNTKIKNIDVKQWKTPIQQEVLSYGWTDSHLLLMTMGTSFEYYLDLTQQNPLANSANFKALTQSLPDDNFGYLYFDMRQLKPVLDVALGMSGEQIPPEVKAFLDSFQGLAMASRSPQDSIIQLDLIVSLETPQSN